MSKQFADTLLDFAPRLIVKRVRKVLRCACETSPTPIRPLCPVAFNHISILVELVGVCHPCRVHVKRNLSPFQSQASGKITPRLLFGSHVVGEVRAQLVDDTDFLHARRVLVALDFHFNVVANV